MILPDTCNGEEETCVRDLVRSINSDESPAILGVGVAPKNPPVLFIDVVLGNDMGASVMGGREGGVASSLVKGGRVALTFDSDGTGVGVVVSMVTGGGGGVLLARLSNCNRRGELVLELRPASVASLSRPL